MKIGDKVDLMNCFSYSNASPMWDTGWTLEIMSGDWCLIMKKTDGGIPDLPQRPVRRKVEISMIRPATPIPESGCAERGDLPDPGAAVMFKVPNSFDDEWAYGLVIRQNPKSIKVLHNNKIINRNFNQFIEVVI